MTVNLKWSNPLEVRSGRTFTINQQLIASYDRGILRYEIRIVIYCNYVPTIITMFHAGKVNPSRERIKRKKKEEDLAFSDSKNNCD